METENDVVTPTASASGGYGFASITGMLPIWGGGADTTATEGQNGDKSAPSGYSFPSMAHIQSLIQVPTLASLSALVPGKVSEALPQLDVMEKISQLNMADMLQKQFEKYGQELDVGAMIRSELIKKGVPEWVANKVVPNIDVATLIAKMDLARVIQEQVKENGMNFDLGEVIRSELVKAGIPALIANNIVPNIDVATLVLEHADKLESGLDELIKNEMNKRGLGMFTGMVPKLNAVKSLAEGHVVSNSPSNAQGEPTKGFDVKAWVIGKINTQLKGMIGIEVPENASDELKEIMMLQFMIKVAAQLPLGMLDPLAFYKAQVNVAAAGKIIFINQKSVFQIR